jgi:hypothetical protein
MVEQMTGRHGGRVSEYAGTRDFTEESPLSVMLRSIGRRGGRENVSPNLAIDQGACEWISVRYGVYRGLVIGKTYVFNGRKGKVVEKRENAGKDGQKSNTGLPRVCVEWKD